MGAGLLRWLMLRQRLSQRSPEAITNLPPTWLIRGKDPHSLPRFLRPGTSGHTLSGTGFLDLGGLGAEVEDQRYEGRDVTGELLQHALGRLDSGGKMASSLLQHRLYPTSDPTFAEVDRHDDQVITCWTRYIEDETKLGSPIVHVGFEMGEEAVEVGSLPGLVSGRDVNAPFREMKKNLGWDVTGDGGFPQSVEGRWIKSVNSLGDSPRSQSAQNADVLGLARRPDCLSLDHDCVSSRQRQEAPVRPIPEFLSAGTELVRLFPGIGIKTTKAPRILPGRRYGSVTEQFLLARPPTWVLMISLIDRGDEKEARQARLPAKRRASVQSG